MPPADHQLVPYSLRLLLGLGVGLVLHQRRLLRCPRRQLLRLLRRLLPVGHQVLVLLVALEADVLQQLVGADEVDDFDPLLVEAGHQILAVVRRSLVVHDLVSHGGRLGRLARLGLVQVHFIVRVVK